MKQLLEFAPIVLFFVVFRMNGYELTLGDWHYVFDGIFTATLVLMVATALQVILTVAITRTFEKRLFWLLAAVCIFGGATLIFRNETFIQWKPTIFNWALAAVFAASAVIGQKNLMERTLGTQIELPKTVWSRLNGLWITYFLLLGALNLVVAYNFSLETWVDYKLYSAIGFTIGITLLTALLIGPHLKEPTEEDSLTP